MSYSELNSIHSVKRRPQLVLETLRRPLTAPEPLVESRANAVMQASARAHLAKTFYDARRGREDFFASSLFADPAWDILLILYWAGHAQQRMKIGSVCAAVAVPVTTAMRWIEHLRGIGLLCKDKHQTDRRVLWVRLSDDAQLTLDQYFDGLLAKASSRFLCSASVST